MPLSPDQRKEVNAILRRYAAGAGLAFVLLVGAFGFTLSKVQSVSSESRTALVKSGRAIAVSGCNRDYGFAGAVIWILDQSTKNAKKNYEDGLITKVQRDRIIAVNTLQNNKISQDDCRTARDILTDNPDAPIPTFTPLHK